MKIGEKYLSNIETSSGKTYELVKIIYPLISHPFGMVQLKTPFLKRFMTTNLTIPQFERYIKEERLKLLPNV